MISKYRQQNRREVTLSDGETKVFVRSLTIAEIALLDIPKDFGKIDASDPKAMADAEKKIPAEKQVEWMKVALVNCVFLSDGEKVVDKHPADCGPKEMSWTEFSQADCNLLMSAISGGAAEKAATFPPQPEVAPLS